ncbi:PDZ domain-containing protein [bacterium]|nr:PDZ domain-containing protein [bacterium]
MAVPGKTLLFTVALLLILSSCWSDALIAEEASPENLTQSALKQLLTGEEKDASSAIDILASNPVDSLIHWITTFEDYPYPRIKGWPFKLIHRISDTLSAPYYVYIPSNYNPAVPAPLMVWLHGGVRRLEFIQNGEEYLTEHPILEICEEMNMILLFPAAKLGCLWWDDVSIDNIFWQIREMKRCYNIDDDRVIIGGFSDGASGSFYLAMLKPTDIAMFFPWSGHMAIVSLKSKIPVYVPNLQCRPLFATNGGRDGLYPSERMMPLLLLAIDHGAELYFTNYDTAGHNYGYLSEEWQPFKERVDRFRRKPLKPHLYWETSNLRYNTLDWLEITELDAETEREEWHVDVNYKLKDERVTIGFNHDTKWEGEGVRVAVVTPDSTLPAFKVGLQEGDIVIGIDDFTFIDIQGLVDAKAKKKRGEKVKLIVKRGDETLEFESEFPPEKEYNAFVLNRPSGAVEATRLGNRFLVKTSRVKSFKIKIHPEMIRLDQTVQLLLNNEDMVEFKVEPDSKYMLNEYLRTRDKRLLWVDVYEYISMDN